MTIKALRTVNGSPEIVFSAFEERARLSVWWGPAGFTNTFTMFEFKPGGKWSFVMHGPDGKNYANEMVVVVIDPPKKIVLKHVSQPPFLLTVTLEPTDSGGTVVGWNQEFEDPDFARRMETFLKTANEQVLDRLFAEVCGK